MVGKKLTRGAVTEDHPLSNNGVQNGATLTRQDINALNPIYLLNLEVKIPCEGIGIHKPKLLGT